jgi:pantoate kinase
MSFKNAVYEGVSTIVVDNFGGGSITVEPGPQPGVVESSINAPDERFLDEINVRHDREHLRISFPPQFYRNANAHLRLGVPPGLNYVIKAGSADIAISADIGRSKIICGSGDITIGRAVDLDCSTGSGDISVSRVEGSAARLSSGSGDVSVGEVHCPATAKSGSGDVLVRSLHGSDLQANSGSGDIAVTSTTGSVDLRSASGSLTAGVADNLPAWLDLSSISGDIRIALESTSQPAEGEPFVSLRAHTGSGDIAVYRA